MFQRVYEGSAFDGCAGEPARVAEALHRFAVLGFEHCSVMGFTPDTLEVLAPELFGR